jgi:hypothetical protein
MLMVRAERLRHDLGLNFSDAVLVSELLERGRKLEPPGQRRSYVRHGRTLIACATGERHSRAIRSQHHGNGQTKQCHLHASDG